MVYARRLLVIGAIGLGCASSDEPTPSAGAGGVAGAGGGTGGVAGDAGGSSTGGGDDRWDCLGSVMAPTPVAPSFDLALTLRDYTSGDDVAGATLEACARDDEPCSNPVVQTTTDANGQGTLTLPTPDTGFDGFFAAAGGGIVPQLLFYPLPLVQQPAGFSTRLVFSPTGLDQEAASLGTTVDPARAVFIYRVHDCDTNNAAGVVVEADAADAQTVAAYESLGNLSTSAPATDSSGFGALFNLPVGTPVNVSYRLADSGLLIGSVEVYVRAGGVTSCPLGPTPRL